MEIIVIHDTSSRTSALKSNQIDYMNDVEVKTAHLLQKEKDIQVVSKTSGLHHVMAMRSDIKPYDNIDVYLAMKHAIDRKQITKLVLSGYGKAGNDHPISENLPFYAAELPQREYDPDKAKYYLKKAGLEGHIFELSTSDEKGMINSALIGKVQDIDDPSLRAKRVTTSMTRY